MEKKQLTEETPGYRYLLHASQAELDLCRVLVADKEDWCLHSADAAYELVEKLDSNAVKAFYGINDRFYLLTKLLNRPDASHVWLYDRVREVELHEFNYLDLWARYHYKSTIVTYAGSIQAILRDPEITIGIFAATQKIAKPFLSQIKDEFEQNETLQILYPDVLWTNPRQDAPSWSLERGITVRRKSNPKEATVEAFGLIDGMPTGRHFKRLVYDDLVTIELVSNPDMIQKVTQRWELSDNLGVGSKTEKVHVGTRYDFADTYGVIMSRGILKPRIYAATEDGTLTGTPVFMDKDHWEKVKNTQRSTVAAQMLQNPLAGKQNTFMPQWLKGYEVRPSFLNVYIMCDPSRGKSATSDRTAIAVVGIDQAGNKFLLDGYCHRMTLSERWAVLRGLWLKWSNERGVAFVKVGYERYGQQTDQEYFEEKMRQQGEVAQFEIIELAWPREGGNSKKHRVERLEPDFNNGRFYLPALVRAREHNGAEQSFWRIDVSGAKTEFEPMRGLTRPMKQMIDSGQGHRCAKPIWRLDEDRKPYDVTLRLIEEMLFFPFAPHDDLVDAVSRIYDMEPISASNKEDKEIESLDDTRDWVDA
jgi:hypothetical protein